MSEISVVVVGSTSVNSVVGNGDTVNVSIGGEGGAGGQAASVQVGTVTATSLASTASATAVVENVGTAYAAKLNMAFGIPRGVQGVQGDPGPVNQITLGTVQTGPDAAAELTGTSPNQTLNLTLPQGPQGQQGIQGIQGVPGAANALSVGSVTTGTTAAVSITGASPSQQISFVLPVGPTGSTGPAGPATTVQVGVTTTGVAGSQAKVETTTAGNTVTLDFTVPRGADGTANLADETPQPPGLASPGTALAAARADHVHPLQVVSYTALTNVPLTFAPSAHTHAISEVTNLQAVLDSKQPTGNYVTLDGSGRVPSAVLPSFVDDVAEYANLAAFPAVGEVGKLYVSRDDNRVHRWSGSTYVEIAASPGSTDAVPEGSTNLYFTTARAASAAPVQSVNGKTGDVVIEAGGIAWSTAPTSTTTATKAGQISYDANYLYVATAVDTWRRTPVEDWTTPVITISVQPSNQTAVGGSATFSVSASATHGAELIYQWQRQAGGTGGWVDIASGLSATLPLTDLQYGINNGDQYRCVISAGSAGSGGTPVNGWLPAVIVDLTPTAVVTSGAGTLTVEAAISITVQPQGVTLTSDTVASFSVAATTPGTGLSYQWQSSPDGTNWTAIGGATAATLAFTGVTQVGYDGYRYRCVISSSGYPDATSAAATLTVAPITVTTQPTSKTATPVAGTDPVYSTTFTVAGTSPAGPPSLQWQVSTDAGSNWSDISGATSPSLSLSTLTWSDTGKRYRARLTKSGWNEVQSNAATLTVPSDSIVVTTQPSNTTAGVSSFSTTSFTLPDGTWSGISLANGKYFATPSNNDFGGDYIATSSNGTTWSLQPLALPVAQGWRPVQYGGGLYLTYGSSSQYAISSDGVNWTQREFRLGTNTTFFPQVVRYVPAVGWVAIAGTQTRLSGDGMTWFSGPGLLNEKTQIDIVGTNVIATSPTTLPEYARVSGGGLTPWETFADLNNTKVVAIAGDLLLTTSVGGSYLFRVFDFSSASPVSTSYSLPDGAYMLAAAYDTARSRWIIVGGPVNGSTGVGGFYTLSSSVAKRFSLPIDPSGAVSASIAGSRVTVYVRNIWGGSSTLRGWYTSDDGGLTWANRSTVVGPLGESPLRSGNILAIPTSSWLSDATPDTGILVDPGGVLSASFTAAASTTFGSPELQWQRSTDGGGTWADVSGATASPYSFSPSSGDNGARYRARFTKSLYTAVTSNAAILTVP